MIATGIENCTDSTCSVDLVPSTARSSSSLAAALPPHLESLLKDSLNKAIVSLAKVLPEIRKISVLEEAEFEDGGVGGFEQERNMQSKSSPELRPCGRPKLMTLSNKLSRTFVSFGLVCL